jgi:hypothetical protein
MAFIKIPPPIKMDIRIEVEDLFEKSNAVEVPAKFSYSEDAE